MADEIIVETTSTEVIEVGVVGPQGPKGDKGDPGDIAGEIAWDNITGKPSTFTPSSHTHAASDITSGTLTHERGGLEADVSAYNGLVKISGGSTSAVGIGTGSTEVAAGDHGHGNINSSGLVGTTANLPLKTGTGGIVEAGAFGTGAGEFAEGNHTHTQLHDKSHSMTDATSHTAGNHKVFYSNGSGEIVELALGNSGEVLTSNGATSAPSFAAASGGGATLMQSIAVGFVLN